MGSLRMTKDQYRDDEVWLRMTRDPLGQLKMDMDA